MNYPCVTKTNTKDSVTWYLLVHDEQRITPEICNYTPIVYSLELFGFVIPNIEMKCIKWINH